MGKKAAAKKAPKEEEKAPAEAASPWICPECEQENEAEEVACIACEAPRPAAAGDDEGRFKGYKVGLVVSAEKIAGKDKLLELKVDVGGENPLPIVTNAGNVKEGCRVVVATVGSTISDKGEDVEVKKSNVGGKPSEGMLCDAPMLGWVGGGGAGAAALLPESFEVGSTPPASRPRGDGK
eukprot:gnl/TRDRNA2_/TRDRNA2_160865_c0_seq3.p1 gnl/TRDRNA2_/TRDRNA2_160865_c0~~gnl/TRDRNA2_/TRDRNA2_160865_c0_seq3.p1  ORF type:complete len:180 (-),score=54.22 gnl/TRDRNA2_/TRDRNA2_160865_c0_seq3:52-591(-)